MQPHLELLASGYGLVEGPRVDADGRLYFSDVTQGGVYCREPDGEISTVVPKRRGVGGIALHAEGGLVISGRNICHVRDGETRVVFEREDVPGFNDLFTDRFGRVLTGSMRSDPFGGAEPRRTGELYRIASDGRVEQLYADVSLTNGIGFSPDGKRLYHADSARNHVIVHDLDCAGLACNRRPLAHTPGLFPDGLAVDEAGCIWVADYGGGCVHRFTPEGETDLRIEIPARLVTSVCFGGSDRRDLYVVTADNTDDASLGGSIHRTRVATPGLPAPLATV